QPSTTLPMLPYKVASSVRVDFDGYPAAYPLSIGDLVSVILRPTKPYIDREDIFGRIIDLNSSTEMVTLKVEDFLGEGRIIDRSMEKADNFFGKGGHRYDRSSTVKIHPQSRWVKAGD